MKKALYLIAAISLAASSAMASKARQKALSNTTAITDVQSIFLNPADVNYVGDFATFEMGESAKNSLLGVSTNTNPDAEGGFLHTMGDAKLGFYLGKQSASVVDLRYLAGGKVFTASGNTVLAEDAFLTQENPFEVFYGAKAGDQNWGISFSYSNSDKKMTSAATAMKQSAMGLRLGVKNDVWGAYANIGLGSTAKTGTDSEYTGKSGITVGGHYLVDSMKYIVRHDMSGAKATYAAADVFDYDTSTTTLGFTNAWKSEGSMAFYGLAYRMTTSTDKLATETKTVTSAIPFTVGAEVLATSWMKLRGSVTQNFMMGSTKVTTPTTTTGADSTAHNTTSAAGAGFVWGKNNLDVVMTMGTNGTLNTAAFGQYASYTYMF